MPARNFSSLEEFFYYRSQLKLHPGFHTSITLNKLPSRPEISKALTELLQVFPQLSFTSAGNSLQHADIDVNEKIIWSQDGIDNIFQERPLDGNCMWEIIVVENSATLILSVNHVLFDGISTMIFWKQFISALNSGSLPMKTDAPITHCYDSIPIPWSWKIKRYLVATLFKLSPKLVTANDPTVVQFQNYKLWNGMLQSFNDDNTYTVANDNIAYNLRLAPAKLSTLLSICKENGVSLTSYLSALVAMSIQNSRNLIGSNCKIEIPMNSRSFCESLNLLPMSQPHIGNYIVSTSVNCQLDKIQDIWQLAKDIQLQITQNTRDNDSVLNNIQNMKLLDVVNVKDFLQSKVGSPDDGKFPDSTFEITNLGLQKFNEPGSSDQYVVQDASFEQPQSISNAFTCSIVSTEKGGLNCEVSYPRNIQEEMDKAIKYIENQCELVISAK